MENKAVLSPNLAAITAELVIEPPVEAVNSRILFFLFLFWIRSMEVPPKKRTSIDIYYLVSARSRSTLN